MTYTDVGVSSAHIVASSSPQAETKTFLLASSFAHLVRSLVCIIIQYTLHYIQAKPYVLNRVLFLFAATNMTKSLHSKSDNNVIV